MHIGCSSKNLLRIVLFHWRLEKRHGQSSVAADSGNIGQPHGIGLWTSTQMKAMKMSEVHCLVRDTGC